MSETIWTDEMILELLKTDLGRKNPSESMLAYLNMLIGTAKEEISRERVPFPAEITAFSDAQLIVSYAAWLYRKRASAGQDSDMPRSLRYMLNNRAFRNQEVL